MAVFDDDFAVVDGLFAEAFGGSIAIHRGDNATTGVTAEVVSREYEVVDSDGFVSVVNIRDYVINVADYQISSTIEDPRAGDRIKETIGGTTHVFEVAPLGSRPAREWVGNKNPQWVVHTKFIGTE